MCRGLPFGLPLPFHAGGEIALATEWAFKRRANGCALEKPARPASWPRRVAAPRHRGRHPKVIIISRPALIARPPSWQRCCRAAGTQPRFQLQRPPRPSTAFQDPGRFPEQDIGGVQRPSWNRESERPCDGPAGPASGPQGAGPPPPPDHIERPDVTPTRESGLAVPSRARPALGALGRPVQVQ